MVASGLQGDLRGRFLRERTEKITKRLFQQHRPIAVSCKRHGLHESHTVATGSRRPILLKKSLYGFCKRQAKKSTSQIGPQTARERRSRVRRPMQTSRERRSATFSTVSTRCSPSASFWEWHYRALKRSLWIAPKRGYCRSSCRLRADPWRNMPNLMGRGVKATLRAEPKSIMLSQQFRW